MKSKNTEAASSVESESLVQNITGLFLRGTVTARQRRTFSGSDGKSRYNITLSINTDTQVYRPERWTDLPVPPDLPAIGKQVILPVDLQVFATKNGTAARLTWGGSSTTENI